MFVHYRTEGFILKKEERGEADLLLTIYTRNFGKLAILGKAARKIVSKLRPAAEIFCLSEIEFIQGKTQKTLTDAILIDKFLRIKKEFKKIRIAHKIAEIMDNLITGQEPDEKIWNLLVETFQKLNTESRFCGTKVKMRQRLIAYCYFYWNLISILGYQPDLYHCVRCHKKVVQEKNYFLPKEGGVVCDDCGPIFAEALAGKEISPETIKILRIILAKDWPTLLKLKFEAQYLKELSLISDNYL